MAPVIEHKHFIARAELSSFFPQNAGAEFFEWFIQLVNALGMRLLSGPHLVYVDREGLRGWTGACIIETSHIVIHVWDEPVPILAEFDVYTCGALDLAVISEALKRFFPTKIDFMVLDREFDLDITDKGTWK